MENITKGKCKVASFLVQLNRQFLYHSMWQIKPKALKEDPALGDELNKKYLEMVKQALEIAEPAYIYTKLKVNSRGEKLVIYTDDSEIEIEAGFFNGKHLTEYIPKSETNEKVVMTAQIVTIGHKPVLQAFKYKKDGQYADLFYWHGFCGALTEALASHIHEIGTKALGYDTDSQRFSFGYEVLPSLADQEKILKLIKASDIGVKMTYGGMISPEYSTCALVFYGDL